MKIEMDQGKAITFFLYMQFFFKLLPLNKLEIFPQV